MLITRYLIVDHTGKTRTAVHRPYLKAGEYAFVLKIELPAASGVMPTAIELAVPASWPTIEGADPDPGARFTPDTDPGVGVGDDAPSASAPDGGLLSSADRGAATPTPDTEAEP